MTEADIVVWDGAYTFVAGNSACNGDAYIEDVLTHEFGHALGLMHSSVYSATMYPYYSYCSQDGRTLDPDDIAGVKALYPAGSTYNSAPTVTVRSPANASSLLQGTSVLFSASATDVQDGDLSARLAWTSSKDGQLGQGGSFWRVLSVGTHVITASVTDAGGMTSSSQKTVTIGASCSQASPTVTLSPSGSVWLPPGTTQSYSATVKSNDGSSCAGATFSLQSVVAAGWTAVFGVQALTLTPGASASTSVKVTSPVSAPNGAYSVVASAANSASPAWKGSATATENITSNLTVSVSTDRTAYTVGQNVNINTTVMLGPAPLAGAKLTVTVTGPDRLLFKQVTGQTNGSGVMKVSFKAATPLGTYGVAVAASQGPASGTATGSLVVR